MEALGGIQAVSRKSFGFSAFYINMHIRISICFDIMTPESVFKCLGDETRLMSTLLIFKSGELCVCDLMAALEESQPKVSRHLAQLRSCGLLTDHRRGQWVYYSMSRGLPAWVLQILEAASTAKALRLDAAHITLNASARSQAC